jgi:glycosyltransferase involved in cell wall biosynthesis
LLADYAITPRMRILRSIHSVNPMVGGPIESVKQSSAVLARLGHQVEIVSLDALGDPAVQQLPVTVHALGPGWGSYGYTPRFTRWIKDRHRDYDAVIVHGLWQYNSFGVWRTLHKTATPYFVFPHGMLDPWFNRTYSLKRLKKLLYWPWAEYRVLRDATAVLFTSTEEKRLARDSFSLYQCKEVVVNYGTAAPDVDLESARHDFFKKFSQLHGKRLLLFLGRLHEKKNCEALIEAFANVRKSPRDDSRSLNLVMAGPCSDDAYSRRLKQLAATLTCDDDEMPITFTGMLSGNLKWGAFRAADAFILPSHQENFGMAIAEALACDTPVLISNKVNIWREIDAARAGYVENDDLSGTTRLITRWLGTPQEIRNETRRNAGQCFARHFEINRAVDSLVSILSASRTDSSRGERESCGAA